jgi:hypothetical protein
MGAHNAGLCVERVSRRKMQNCRTASRTVPERRLDATLVVWRACCVHHARAERQI